MSEVVPLTSLGTSALEAARVLATRRLPGLIVTDDQGRQYVILPPYQVVRFLVPSYRAGRSVAGPGAQRVARPTTPQTSWGRVRFGTCCPRIRTELAVVNHDATSIEVAARSWPGCASAGGVMDGRRYLGAIFASRLLSTRSGS